MNMAMNKFITALLMLGAVLMVACGDSDEKDEVSGIETLDDFEREVDSFACELVDDCLLPSGIKSLLMQSDHRGECLGSLFQGGPFEEERVSLAEGKTIFDPVSATACIEQARNDCSHLDVLDCEGMFVGTVEEGAFCRGTHECSPGLRCSVTGSDVCDQACTPLADVGEACVESRDCARGPQGERTFCDENARCALQVVVNGAAEGDDCGVLDDDSRQVSCQSGLHCAFVVGVDEGICKAAISVGGECGLQDPCQGNDLCLGGVCTAVEIRGEGESCDAAPVEGRASLMCNELSELICDQGTCQPLSGGGQGEACRAVSNPFARACDEGLFCNLSDRCEPPRSDGEPCSSRRNCESGHCDRDSDLCAPEPVCE